MSDLSESASAPQQHEENKKKLKHEDAADDDDETHLYIPDAKDAKIVHRVMVRQYPKIKKYLSMTKPELQKWLRHNGQLVSGRKLVLLLRCIDGEINGRLPGCPKCHHGQMQYDVVEGKYICNGYFDEMSRTPIHCGNTMDSVKREPWHQLETDPPVQKGEVKHEGEEQSQHHREHEEHHHSDHHCKNEANHDLVDLLEDMAYYHSILKDENWGFRARAFISAARAVEQLPFVIDGKVHDALSLGNKSDTHHIEKIGKSSAEVMQAYLDSGRKRSPQLEELKALVKRKHKGE